MSFSGYDTALEMRRLIENVAAGVVNKLRPRPRYGAVQSIDDENAKCTVLFVGDTEPVEVNTGSLVPSHIGQRVKVEGLGVDKCVTALYGNEGVTIHAASTGPFVKLARIFTGTRKEVTLDASTPDQLKVQFSSGGTDSGSWLFNSDGTAYYNSEVLANQIQIGPPALPAEGLLDPYYRTAGPAKVKVDGESTFTGPYNWLHTYDPRGSRRVLLQRDYTNSTWVIEGQKDPNKILLPLASNWTSYNLIVGSHTWALPKAQLLPSGIVVLSGLIRAKGTVTDGQLVGTLPSGMRPDYEIIFGVNQSDTTKYVAIKTDGRILFGEGMTGPTGFISLDGIAFPAAGVASWTFVDPAGTAGSDHTFANGWTEYASGGGVWGRCRYWKDPYGFVWLGGMAAAGGTADNTKIFSMNSSCTAYRQQHVATVAMSNFGIVGVQDGQAQVNYKLGSAGNGWISLGGVTFVTPDAHNNNPWYTWPTLLNGWLNYDTAGFKNVASLRRGDGLGFLHGMIKSGLIGGQLAYLEQESMPEQDILMHAAANAARARVDLGGREITSKLQGAVYPQQGSNVWYSLDSLKYMI